jgi:hypothetical protein
MENETGEREWSLEGKALFRHTIISKPVVFQIYVVSPAENPSDD